jgi:hypothetical protein
VEILDNSKIEIGKVLYDKAGGKFLVEIRNVGETDVFVDLELVDLLINDELVTIGAGKVIFIKKGESVFIEVPVVMAEQDLQSNPKVKIRGYYGERERSLVNVIEGEFSYGYTGWDYMIWQFVQELLKKILLFLPLIIIILLLLLILGMKKKCQHCGEINKLRAKVCKNCGQDI